MGGVRGESGGANEEGTLVRSHCERWRWGRDVEIGMWSCTSSFALVVLKF